MRGIIDLFLINNLKGEEKKVGGYKRVKMGGAKNVQSGLARSSSRPGREFHPLRLSRYPRYLTTCVVVVIR